MPRTGERNADRDRNRVCGIHLRVGPTENRTGSTLRQGQCQRSRCTGRMPPILHRKAGRFAGRSEGGEQGRGAGEPPQLARRTTVFTVPDRCFGLVRGSVTAPCGNGPGNRYRAGNAASPAEPPGTTGDVRSSERLTPAGRPSVDGSSHAGLPWAAKRLRPQRSRGSSLFPAVAHLGVILAKPLLGVTLADCRRRSRPVSDRTTRVTGCQPALRDEWFERLDELGLDADSPDVPEVMRDDRWWRDVDEV